MESLIQEDLPFTNIMSGKKNTTFKFKLPSPDFLKKPTKTDVTEEKGQMGEESEDTTGMRIFDLGLNHAIAILALLVGGAFTIRWLAGYRYRVPSWGKDPPSGQ